MKKKPVHLKNKVDWFQDTSLKWSICAAASQLLTRTLTDQETTLQGVPRLTGRRTPYVCPPLLKRYPSFQWVNSGLSRSFVQTAGRAGADYRARCVSCRS